MGPSDILCQPDFTEVVKPTLQCTTISARVVKAGLDDKVYNALSNQVSLLAQIHATVKKEWLATI